MSIHKLSINGLMGDYSRDVSITGNPDIGTAPEFQGKKSSWVRKKFDFRSPSFRQTKSTKSDCLSPLERKRPD